MVPVDVSGQPSDGTGSLYVDDVGVVAGGRSRSVWNSDHASDEPEARDADRRPRITVLSAQSAVELLSCAW